MKKLMMQLTITAATLLAASTASAQTMRIDVPFEFTAANKVMPAGVYNVYRSVGEKSFTLRSVQNDAHVVLLTTNDQDPAKVWRNAANGEGVFQFDCSHGCTLQQIWTNKAYPSHVVQGATRGKEGNSRLAFIAVR